MEATYTIIMFVVGILLGAIGLFKGWRTKDTKKIMTVITVLLLGLSSLAFLGVEFLAPLNQPLAIGEVPSEIPTIEPKPAVDTGEKLCPVEDVTITLSAQDKYTAAAAGGTHRYRINGAPAKTVSDTGTFTASPGDVLKILWMNGSLTSYFSKVDTFTVPCVGTKTFYTEVVNNGSLTTNVWNEEGDLIDSSGTNETLDAGDVASLDFEIKGAYQKEFPYGLVLVLEYNKTTIDDVVIEDELANELEEVSIPQIYTTSYGVDSATKAYLLPPIISNAKFKGTITLDADDSNDPGTGTDGDIAFTYYPRNYFINEDKGGAFDGPAAEDEDNVATRTGAFTYTLQVD